MLVGHGEGVEFLLDGRETEGLGERYSIGLVVSIASLARRSDMAYGEVWYHNMSLTETREWGNVAGEGRDRSNFVGVKTWRVESTKVCGRRGEKVNDIPNEVDQLVSDEV